LVLFWKTGTWPSGYVDHINRQRDDNRLANLRICTHVENMRFRGGGVNKTDRGDWTASIGCRFSTRREALLFRKALEKVRDNWASK